MMEEDRVLPSDRQLENIALGCLLVNKVTLNKHVSEVNEDLFFYYENKIICKSILDLYGKDKPVDIITVSNNLKETGGVNKIENAVHYVVSLTSRVVSTENFESYLIQLKELSIKRYLLEFSSKYVQRIFDRNIDAFDLISSMQQELEYCVKSVTKQNAEVVRDIHIRNIKESLNYLKLGTSSGVKTNLKRIDNLTNGWQKSDLIIIAGRPAMGKTALAMNLALSPAVNENKAVLVFSLEMSKEQLVGRLESLLSGIDVSRIIKKQLKKEEIDDLDNKCAPLYKCPIYIDDTPSISLLELKSKARKMHLENNIELIVIDYLQLMRSGYKIGNREQEIAEISRGLKSLAKELNVPIIALSQLSRAVESRADKKPLLSDLRESGQIEQDADMVVFCYRPEYYEIETYDIGSEQLNTDGLFMLIWAKHRNGELGEVPLTFIKSCTKITDYQQPTYTPTYTPTQPSINRFHNTESSFDSDNHPF